MEEANNYKTILADNIERILKARNMKKQDLAADSGISVSFISDITNLKANPSVQNITKIARALAVPLPLLFIPLDTNWTEIDAVLDSGHVYVIAKVTHQESFVIKRNYIAKT